MNYTPIVKFNDCLIPLPENGTLSGVTDKYYRHVQVVPSLVWIITHNLEKRPSINIFDSGGELVLTEISYINNNIAKSTSTSSFGGEAICN